MAAAKKTKKGAVNLDDLFDDDLLFTREVIPTGIAFVDPVLGGGIPQGVLGEVFGPTGSGKTSLMYAHIAQQQKAGNVSVLFDTEGSWNPGMGARYGIDPEHVNAKGVKTFLKSSKPETQIIESLFAAIKAILYNRPDVTFILVDSLAVLTTKKVTERKDDDQRNTEAMARAAMLSVYLRDLLRWQSETGNKCSVVFVNHEKDVIGFNGNGPVPTDTGGGKSIKYLSTFRLKFRLAMTETVEVKDPVTEQKHRKADKLYIRVEATKNRIAVPYKPATFIFDVGGGTGIDFISTALAHASAQGVITAGGGGYYTIPAEYSTTPDAEKELKIQGKVKLKRYFEENPDLFQKLEADLVANLSGSAEVVIEENEEDDDDLTLEGIKA